MVAHLALAAGFFTAVLGEPPTPPGAVRAALTGPVSYLFIAAIHSANAAVYGRRGPATAPGSPTDSDTDVAPGDGPAAGEAGVRA